jgi:hypothetical protein
VVAGLFFVACAAALVLGSDVPSYIDAIEVSSEGVRRTRGPRLWVKKVEAISWDDLSKVEIMADGANPESMSFLLDSSSRTPLAVSDVHSETEGLLFEMQRRLPRFDERQVERAYDICRRAKDGRVLVWQRPAPGPVS